MKIRLTAAFLAAAVGVSVPCYASFTPDTSNDGFTTGYYEETEDAAAKAETESLYAEKPDAQRRVEYLDRGLVAVPGDGGTLVSWRFLGTDPQDIKWDLYRNGEKLNTAPISGTNFFDEDAPAGAEYRLVMITETDGGGEETTATAWDKEYTEFKVKEYETGDYIIDDGAVGDLDGDGQYELLLRRIPKDMSVETRVAYPIIEAYELTGEYMWTINIGPNEINEHDLNMMVYDFNGDGKAEVIMRSFEGTTDGTGNVITGENGEVTDYTKQADNLAIFQDRQYIVSTPEYLSMYDGETGAEMDRIDLLPSQTPLSEWSYRYTDTGRLTKRASHHLFGLAYLDGVTPSFVEVRGAWDNVRAAAWHIEDDKFVLDWEAETPNAEDVNSIYGAANHNLAVADVDFDGKDEILSGPMAIDDDGSTMYAVNGEDAEGNTIKLGHGDAFDVAVMDPEYPGYYVWACHETSNLPANIELHDARTGQLLFGWGKNKDTGRSRAADIDPTYPGYELWGSTATVPMNIGGEKIADGFNEFYTRLSDGTYQMNEDGTYMQGTLPMNFKIYWDGDLLSEFLDGIRVSKWNWTDKVIEVLFDADGCASNCGTKAVPCAAADLFGDWRDEIVWKTEDESGIRIYSTNIETRYRIPMLMHDRYYRASVAMQNNHYNQPANVDFYLGYETTEIPAYNVYTEKDGVRISSPDAAKPYTIDVGYAKRAADTVTLRVDSPYAYADDRIVMIDEDNSAVVPTIVNDRTLVPVRFISEVLGMDIAWDGGTQQVTVSGGGRDIVMHINNASYTVNGETKTLEAPPQIMNDRTMLPLRAVAEAFGKAVSWDQTGRLIVISDSEINDWPDRDKIVEALTSGREPDPEPIPTPTPMPEATPAGDPLEGLEYTEKQVNGTAYKIYVDEDYSSYSEGDAAGWAGTKPAPMPEIGVSADGAMHFGGSDKGNRNAVYNLPGPMTGKAYISLDWDVGEMTGGSSVGELRFADSEGNVFLSFKTSKDAELEYNYGGKISNQGLETLPWTGIGLTGAGVVHIEAEADFETKTVTFTLTQNGKSFSGEMTFENAEDLAAVEMLAVRNEKNWEWSTEIDNMVFGTAE